MMQSNMYSSWRLLREAFLKQGYTVREDFLDNRRVVSFTSSSGKVWFTSAAQLSYPLFNGTVRKVSANKQLAYEFVKHYDISIPRTTVVEHKGKLDIKDVIGRSKRVIVKPTNSSASRGVILGIANQEALDSAANRAREYSEKIIVQEQVVGQEVRFAVFGGKVVAVLLRQKPQIVGDGVSTVAELVKSENEDRKNLVFPYVSYPQLDADLIDESFMTDIRIPLKNEIVELGRSTMIKGGASVYNIIDKVDRSYIRIAEKIVRELGAEFLVVDLIIEDYRRLAMKDNYWFLEFNTSPSLKLFYGCRDGRMFDIVPMLVTVIDKRIHV